VHWLRQGLIGPFAEAAASFGSTGSALDDLAPWHWRDEGTMMVMVVGRGVRVMLAAIRGARGSRVTSRPRRSTMSYGFLQRCRPSTSSAVVVEPRRPSRRVFELADIEPGWVVRDRDGRRIGRVVAVSAGTLTVARGWLRPRLRVLPSDIRAVREGQVILNVVPAELRDLGGRRRP